MSRSWGPWTEVKLDALSGYLRGFATASKRSPRTLYLDLFAGALENESRLDGRTIAGSAERALQTVPHLSKLIFCEINGRRAAELEAALRDRYPERDFTVLGDDCNTAIRPALEGLDRVWRLAPTFAFVDQFAAEVHWKTLEYLSTYKDPKRTKVELWLYFGDGLIPRGAYGTVEAPAHPSFLKRVDEMFGTDQWREIRRGRLDGLLTPEQQRDELVNLMRWRLENVLGYRTTLPLALHNEHGAPIYTMIFATDHPAGEDIMRYIFGSAGKQLGEMMRQYRIRAREAREAAQQQSDALFPIEAVYPVAEFLRTPSLAPAVPPWRYPGTS